MIIAYQPETAPIRPEVWAGRKFRLPPARARLVVELAFANRIATLADRGAAYVEQPLNQEVRS